MLKNDLHIRGASHAYDSAAIGTDLLAASKDITGSEVKLISRVNHYRAMQSLLTSALEASVVS
jgi:hypothetical protein